MRRVETRETLRCCPPLHRTSTRYRERREASVRVNLSVSRRAGAPGLCWRQGSLTEAGLPKRRSIDADAVVFVCVRERGLAAGGRMVPVALL